MQPLTWERREAFRGDPRKALDTAKVALLGLGFEIEHASDEAIVARGPGTTSTNQPALRAATRVEVRVSGGMLTVSAELGGVRRLQRFLMVFPVAMAALFLLIYSLLFGVVLRRAIGLEVIVLVLAPLVPFLVLSPLPSRLIRRRTEAALEGFVRSIAACS